MLLRSPCPFEQAAAEPVPPHWQRREQGIPKVHALQVSSSSCLLHLPLFCSFNPIQLRRLQHGGLRCYMPLQHQQHCVLT